MILSREFIPADILFKSDDVFLLDALEEVYERMGSNAAITEGMQSVYQPEGGIKLFLPCNEVPFHRPVRVDHWMRWKAWNEFSSAFMNLPAVKQTIVTCDEILRKQQYPRPSKETLESFYAGYICHALNQSDDLWAGTITHRDLLRFYLGLSKIPDEKLFSLI
jgi:hypothetical protein